MPLEEFFEKGRPEDVLLLYLAGHGDLDDRGNFYFVAKNTKSDRLRGSGIADRYIHETMVRSLSKRQILILDCCYSGAFSKDWISRGDASVGIKQKLTGEGRIVLTASDALEFAYEKRGPLGEVKSLFTSRIIEGMEGGQADLDGDGFISVEELYNYVEERIRCEDPAQRPLKSGFTHGQLWLGRAVPRKDAIPRNLLDLLQHNYATVRLAGIDELERLVSVYDDVIYPAASKVLTKLLSDGDATVKRVAASALRRFEAEQRERQRLEDEKRDKERLETEQREKQRLEAERQERERQEEQLEKARQEAERLEKGRLEAHRLEKERLEAEQREKQRLQAERLEKERREAQQREKDSVEAKQRERDRLDAERRAKEQLETERGQKEEQDRVWVEQNCPFGKLEARHWERDRQKRFEAERRETEKKERLEAERRQKKEQERLEAERHQRKGQEPLVRCAHCGRVGRHAFNCPFGEQEARHWKR